MSDNFDDVRAALAIEKWKPDFRYGVRDDDSAWYSIGDPVTGPHRQGDIYADEDTLAMIALAHNRLPALLAELDAARAEVAKLAWAWNEVQSPTDSKAADKAKLISAAVMCLNGMAWLAARDAEQWRLGVAEGFERAWLIVSASGDQEPEELLKRAAARLREGK